jgi:glutamate dehydrogenase/leucine dehydrogenase
VESLGGRYITAADMGTGEQQMAVIRERTRHVVGLPRELGGCGDPGPFTARGVHMALVAALGGTTGGARVAVQGVGSVGSPPSRVRSLHLVDHRASWTESWRRKSPVRSCVARRTTR